MNQYVITVEIDEAGTMLEEYVAEAFTVSQACLQILVDRETIYYPLTSIFRFSIVKEEVNG